MSDDVQCYFFALAKYHYCTYTGFVQGMLVCMFDTCGMFYKVTSLYQPLGKLAEKSSTIWIS